MTQAIFDTCRVAPRDPSREFRARVEAKEYFSGILDDERLQEQEQEARRLRQEMHAKHDGKPVRRRRRRPTPDVAAVDTMMVEGGGELNHPDMERTLRELASEYQANERLLADLRERKASERDAASRSKSRSPAGLRRSRPDGSTQRANPWHPGASRSVSPQSSGGGFRVSENADEEDKEDDPFAGTAGGGDQEIPSDDPELDREVDVINDDTENMAHRLRGILSGPEASPDPNLSGVSPDKDDRDRLDLMASLSPGGASFQQRETQEGEVLGETFGGSFRDRPGRRGRRRGSRTGSSVARTSTGVLGAGRLGSSHARPLSRSERVTMEELKQREAAEEAETKVRVKARPVPSSTLEPRLRQMEERQKKQREEGHAQRVAKLKDGFKNFPGMEERLRKKSEREEERKLQTEAAAVATAMTRVSGAARRHGGGGTVAGRGVWRPSYRTTVQDRARHRAALAACLSKTGDVTIEQER